MVLAWKLLLSRKRVKRDDENGNFLEENRGFMDEVGHRYSEGGILQLNLGRITSYLDQEGQWALGPRRGRKLPKSARRVGEAS